MLKSILVTAAVLLASGGCSFAVVSEENRFDPDLALETLDEALFAWQSGNARVLIQLSPPIRFVDDDLAAGFGLVEYEVRAPARLVRPFQGIPVTLTLQRGNDASITREAEYQVSLEAVRAVLRSDP